jgi:SAM-dependent methyltransferase
MSIEPVPFEPRRFRTAAAHYPAGRPGYAPRLIRRVVEFCKLGTADRVLDLGCGPGQLANAFAPFAGAVVGIDPEPEMLRLAALDVPANVRFLEGSSYGLGPHLGMFQLVTMGRSFHWMDRVDTLQRLEGMIEPGGAVALFGDKHPELPENAWRQAFQDLVGRYAADDLNRHQRHEPGRASHIAVLLDSAFCELEEISVIERRELPAAALIERALSMSSTSQARIGDRVDALVAEIEALTAQLAPAGRLVEVVASTALIARRGG